MEPDYVVLRSAPGLPEGFLPEGFEGLWFDMSQIPARKEEMTAFGATTIATGQFEFREDGAVAEVFEVQPCE